MVAIVLAAGFTLWVVGLRRQNDFGWRRHVGNALVVVTMLLAVYLTQRLRIGAPVMLPGAARAAVQQQLPVGLRLVDVQAHRGRDELVVTVRAGGERPPAAGLAERLRAALAPLVRQPVRMRLTYEWEALASPPPAEGR